MKLNMFKSKIHRATVTHADLKYEGSVTIDSNLMAAAEILPFEAIHVWNITNGQRLVTYALPGEAGSGIVCVNGAAAHHHKPGDLVILATFAEMTVEEARAFTPQVVRVEKSERPERFLCSVLHRVADRQDRAPAPACPARDRAGDGDPSRRTPPRRSRRRTTVAPPAEPAAFIGPELE